jgi:hypothetical protein
VKNPKLAKLFRAQDRRQSISINGLYSLFAGAIDRASIRSAEVLAKLEEVGRTTLAVVGSILTSAVVDLNESIRLHGGPYFSDPLSLVVTTPAAARSELRDAVALTKAEEEVTALGYRFIMNTSSDERTKTGKNEDSLMFEKFLTSKSWAETPEFTRFLAGANESGIRVHVKKKFDDRGREIKREYKFSIGDRSDPALQKHALLTVDAQTKTQKGEARLRLYEESFNITEAGLRKIRVSENKVGTRAFIKEVTGITLSKNAQIIASDVKDIAGATEIKIKEGSQKASVFVTVNERSLSDAAVEAAKSNGALDVVQFERQGKSYSMIAYRALDEATFRDSHEKIEAVISEITVEDLSTEQSTDLISETSTEEEPAEVVVPVVEAVAEIDFSTPIGGIISTEIYEAIFYAPDDLKEEIWQALFNGRASQTYKEVGDKALFERLKFVDSPLHRPHVLFITNFSEFEKALLEEVVARSELRSSDDDDKLFESLTAQTQKTLAEAKSTIEKVTQALEIEVKKAAAELAGLMSAELARFNSALLSLRVREEEIKTSIRSGSSDSKTLKEALDSLAAIAQELETLKGDHAASVEQLTKNPVPGMTGKTPLLKRDEVASVYASLNSLDFNPVDVAEIQSAYDAQLKRENDVRSTMSALVAEAQQALTAYEANLSALQSQINDQSDFKAMTDRKAESLALYATVEASLGAFEKRFNDLDPTFDATIKAEQVRSKDETLASWSAFKKSVLENAVSLYSRMIQKQTQEVADAKKDHDEFDRQEDEARALRQHAFQWQEAKERVLASVAQRTELKSGVITFLGEEKNQQLLADANIQASRLQLEALANSISLLEDLKASLDQGYDAARTAEKQAVLGSVQVKREHQATKENEHRRGADALRSQLDQNYNSSKWKELVQKASAIDAALKALDSGRTQFLEELKTDAVRFGEKNPLNPYLQEEAIVREIELLQSIDLSATGLVEDLKAKVAAAKEIEKQQKKNIKDTQVDLNARLTSLDEKWRALNERTQSFTSDSEFEDFSKLYGELEILLDSLQELDGENGSFTQFLKSIDLENGHTEVVASFNVVVAVTRSRITAIRQDIQESQRTVLMAKHKQALYRFSETRAEFSVFDASIAERIENTNESEALTNLLGEVEKVMKRELSLNRPSKLFLI